MPMLLPVVAAFAAGTAGMAAVGAAAAAGSTLGLIAGYASVAGAVMTGVGALTGSKDLMKIGAVLSIGGGLTSWATGAAAGGGAAAGAEALGEASGAWAGSEAATAAASGAGDAAAATMPEALGEVAGYGPGVGESVNGATVGTMTTQAAKVPTNLLDAGKPLADPNSLTAAAATEVTTPLPASVQKVQDLSNGLIKSGDLSAWWKRAAEAGGAVGKFIEANPGLVKIGAGMLEGAFGTEAQKMEFAKKKYGDEQSLLERNRANLNSPIKMAYTPRS